MLWVALIGGVAFWIVIFACAIVLKWILPAATYATLIRAVSRFCTLMFQLCIVVLGALIVYAVWYVWAHPTP